MDFTTIWFRFGLHKNHIRKALKYPNLFFKRSSNNFHGHKDFRKFKRISYVENYLKNNGAKETVFKQDIRFIFKGNITVGKTLVNSYHRRLILFQKAKILAYDYELLLCNFQ